MVTIYGSAESVVLRIITIYEYYSRGEGKCLCFSDKIAKCFLYICTIYGRKEAEA